MSDTQDSLFLKLAVSKGLVDQALGKEVFLASQKEHRSAADLLIERGVMTAYNVDLLNKELIKSQGPKTVAGFQIVGKLGQGGMGAVYKATQLSIGREVALKVMAPEVAKNKGFVERFLREGMAMGAINHPNVVTCYDAGQDGKILYMALELMTGGDADQLARELGGILPPVRACMIVRDCAAGLSAIHRAGLIHRDIKPANIFLGEDGTAKLADLGLARHEDGDDKMTRTGTAMGTPAFMSPEQAEGADDLDIRSDIYALGATLFSLVTGQPPFTGQSAYAVVAKVINDPVPDPRTLNPNVPDGVVQIIRSAMHKDRNKRYQTPQELLAALKMCGEELLKAGLTADTVGALPPSLIRHPTPHTHTGPVRHYRTNSHSTIAHGRNWLVSGAVFTGVAVLVVIGASLVLGRTPPKNNPVSSPATASETLTTAIAPAASKPAPPPTKPVEPSTNLKPGDPWPDREAWTKAVSALPLDRRVALVGAALQQLNPYHNAQLRPALDVQKGEVPSIELAGADLHDVRPLTALPSLHAVILTSTIETDVSSPFYELDQLDGLPLTELGLSNSMVNNLTALRGKPLTDINVTGCPISDLTPILGPALRRVAFNTATAEVGIEALRALPNIEGIGATWQTLQPPLQFWRNYDAGTFPLPPSKQAKIFQAAEQKPQNPVEDQPPTAAVAKPTKPSIIAIKPLVIPENAVTKVRDIGKTFNDSCNKITGALGARRKDASRNLAKVLDADFKREMATIAKNTARFPIADAVRQARDALVEGTSPRDPVFSDPNLPPSTLQALADWRATIEPLEAELADQAETLRLKALKDLEPLVTDNRTGASELTTQLATMLPPTPLSDLAVEPLPVEGCIWRIESMSALPRDTVLRDLTANQGPARMIGELVETDYGKAFRGDGRTTQISTGLKKPLAERSLMAWVNTTYAQQLNGGVIGLQSPDGARYESIVHCGPENGWGMQNELRRSFSGKGGYREGAWRHLAMVIKGSTRTLYLNGKEILKDHNATVSFPAGSEIIVGKRNSSREPGRYYAGMIDGCLIFDKALTLHQIEEIIRFQSERGENIRTTVRAREWVNLPLPNADFSRFTGVRFTDWNYKLDGITQGTDGAERWLKMDLNRVGLEARVLRVTMKIDPSWRSMRLNARMRIPKALIGEEPQAGVFLVFSDPTGTQPELRRMAELSADPVFGAWQDIGPTIGWPVPPGYATVSVECSLHAIGTVEIDDVKLQVLSGH